MNADYIRKLLSCFAEVMQENKEFLIEQDSIVGGGDLGLTMSDGFQAAAQCVSNDGNPDGKRAYAGGKSFEGAG